jgi:hypothetical protein
MKRLVKAQQRAPWDEIINQKSPEQWLADLFRTTPRRAEHPQNPNLTLEKYSYSSILPEGWSYSDSKWTELMGSVFHKLSQDEISQIYLSIHRENSRNFVGVEQGGQNMTAIHRMSAPVSEPKQQKQPNFLQRFFQ